MRVATCICLLAYVIGVVVCGDAVKTGIKKFGISVGAAAKLGSDLFNGPYKDEEMEREIPKMGGRKASTGATLRLEHVREHSAQEKEKKKSIIEGDIVLNKVIKDIVENKAVKSRELLENAKWPKTKDIATGNNVVNIAYKFDDSLGSSAKKAINDAFEDYKDLTCLRFQTRQSEPDYIKFFQGSGCYSYVGRVGGEQELSVGSGCEYKGTVLHEIMHAVGFFHEHTRPDRDEYVKIHFDKIRPGMENNFKKYDHNLVTELNAKYDLLSIMHYNQFAFSEDIGEKTITPVDPKIDGESLGQRSGLTKTDIAQINAAYCDQPLTTTTSPTTTTPAPATTATTTTIVPGILPTTSTTTLDPDLLKPGTTTTTTLAPGQTTPTTTTPTPTTTTPGPEACGYPTCDQCQNPPCQQAGGCSGQAPCWPQDFQWSNTGYPQSCGCGGEQQPGSQEQPKQEEEEDKNDKKCKLCKCLAIKTKRSPKSWQHNHFCYKAGKHDPHFILMRNGNIAGKRCLLIDDSKEWENLHLCFNKSAPYDLSWSDVDQVSANGKSRCLKMGNQHDWSWGKQKFLCQSPN